MKSGSEKTPTLALFIVFALPFLVILYLLISEINIGIRFADQERLGLEYSGAVRNFVEKVQQHRRVTTESAANPRARSQATAEVQQAIERVDTVDQKLGGILKATDRWALLRKDWQQFATTPSTGPPDTSRHDALVNEAISLVLHVGDTSNLILDPDLDSYYSMDAVVTKLLPIAEHLAQSRRIGLTSTAPTLLSPEAKTQLIIHGAAIREALSAVDRGMGVAVEHNPSLKGALTSQANSTFATREFLAFEPRLIDSKLNPVAPAELVAVTDRAIGQIYRFFDETATGLDGLLVKRSAGFTRKKLWVGFFALIAMAAAGYVFWSFAGGESTRRQAEEDLRSSELRKGAILESALDSIITIDFEGRVVEFNPAAERTFGYRREETLGKELAALIVPPALREGHRRGLAHYRATREGPVLGKRIEINAMHANGHEFMVELAITPVRVGETTMFTAYLRDITERLRTAEDLRKTKEAAEAANRAKSEFLANISHEIRTPMNGILGMTELAMNTELTPPQREYLTLVKSSAESLLALLNDLLDFSKIEAGKLDLENVAFALRDMLGDTMQSLAIRAAEKGLELALHVLPDVPDALTGDPYRLRQVIVNLVGNSIKFTERGEVTVRVETVAEQEEASTLCFTVVDSGIGIPAEARGRIFAAFEQADASTTRTHGGTGLGLAITSRIVSLMNGKISVESEVGRGSRFTFTARFGRQKGTVGVDRLPELEGLRVLAVDDHETNRVILRELFTSWHMDVTVAASAAIALKELAAAQQEGRPFVLVVTDLMMPEMDGLDFIARVKSDSEIGQAHIILLTSAGRAEDAERSRALGVDAHLSKPFKHSVLLDTMLELLGSRRAKAQAPPATIQRQRPLRVLLAEDNAVNRRMAVVNLESWGHRVTVANDGNEAVAAAKKETFDLVLMDCQMPRLGGFEATSLIRKEEQSRGGHVPIIAMTANVMKGFREECLAAGMDGYVAKPIRRNELIDAMAKAVPGLLLEGTAPISTPSGHTTRFKAEIRAFDADALLESIEGNPQLLREMIQLCSDVDGPRLCRELAEGIKINDFKAVERAAHGIKGLVSEFHATVAYQQAKELEETARQRNPELIQQQAAALDRQCQLLIQALNRFASESAGPEMKPSVADNPILS